VGEAGAFAGFGGLLGGGDAGEVGGEGVEALGEFLAGAVPAGGRARRAWAKGEWQRSARVRARASIWSR